VQQRNVILHEGKGKVQQVLENGVMNPHDAGPKEDDDIWIKKDAMSDTPLRLLK